MVAQRVWYKEMTDRNDDEIISFQKESEQNS